LVNRYERDPTARKECIKIWGCLCAVCDFDFSVVYGEIGREFIHVHHLTKISSLKSGYLLDPRNDLRPVCPNCHAMLHKKDPPFSIDELRQVLAKASLGLTCPPETPSR
jgi:5-methylcytosine-specific restriction protein A